MKYLTIGIGAALVSSVYTVHLIMTDEEAVVCNKDLQNCIQRFCKYKPEDSTCQQLREMEMRGSYDA